MTFDEIYRQIADVQPAIVYLTGKTCTGKSTFAKRLNEEFGYKIIELDQVVNDAVIEPLGLEKERGSVFVSVYKTDDNPEWTRMFIAETRRRIKKAVWHGSKVVIDGAIANTKTVAKVFDNFPEVPFIYFHPAENSEAYVQNLTHRFMGTNAAFQNGLPNTFWQYVDQQAFQQFCQDGILTPKLRGAIFAYAEQSAHDSAARLANFQAHFPNVRAIEV